MSKNLEIIQQSLKKRARSESLFRYLGILGIVSAVSFLIIILFSVISEGKSAFKISQINLNVFFDPKIIAPSQSQNINEIKK